ncbi:ABC transporter permease [Burkholderia singularis]|uniref:ABC transporter permease n=1 Tax=Burkholderia singularis TaxID=1503053 RepID=A0A103DZT0_9BURK|nr:ABC transporter permease [Burkholderia singularis]KVE25767.1 ABC transporter permease [Burkholderia singularis]
MLKVFAILVRNELLGFLRSRSSLFWTLVFPVFLLSVMLFAFGGSNSLGTVDVAFDAPGGTTPYRDACRAEIVASLARSDVVKATIVAAGARGSAERVNVVLGADAHTPATIRYDFNGSLAAKAASRVIEIALARCAAQRLGLPAEPARFENAAPERRAFDYGAFFATGILVMAFMAIGLNSTATAIAALRERNTFKLYVCFPVSRGVFLGALIVARMAMMALSAVVLLAVARFAFGIALPIVSPAGLRALPVVLLGAAMVLSFGVLLASRAQSLAAAELACNVTYYPLLFFSDLTIPMHDAPSWLKAALAFLPTNQFAVALRGLLLDGAQYAQFAPQLAGMAASTLLFLIVSARLFRWHDA